MDKRTKTYQLGMIRRLILAWLIAGTVMYLKLSDKQKKLEGLDGLREMSFPQFILILIITFFVLCLLAYYNTNNNEKKERYSILIVFFILAISALKVSFSVPFFCGEILIGIILFFYAKYGYRVQQNQTIRSKIKPIRVTYWFAGCFTLFFFGFVSIWTVLRVFTYSAPTFDFGIFSQMFYYIRKTGIPYTTLERNGLLSHFQVHVSPIYYLLLPFYCLFPVPITLQILQAMVLASAGVPIWRLAKKHGCAPFLRLWFCLLLFLYPAYSGGASYDIHENIFLTPLLFWLFYAIDCQNRKGCFIFGILTCMVKEDAAVYVAVVALYWVFRSLLELEKEEKIEKEKKNSKRQEIITGVLLFFLAFIWFLLATQYLVRYGDGVMTNRYQNFLYDSSGSLFTVVKTALLSPIKVLYECMDQEKISFILLTILPLCGIPFFTRKYERFILLIPYILVNLMSDYPYQHNIFFQYTYGSTACLFYLTIINSVDFISTVRNYFLKLSPFLLSILISAACFGRVVFPKAARYWSVYQSQKTYLKEIEEQLQIIPDNASVTATTFYTVPLSNRDILYDVRYSSLEHILRTEYIVLDVSDIESYIYFNQADKKDGYKNFTAYLEENGYQVIAELEGKLVIYSSCKKSDRSVKKVNR